MHERDTVPGPGERRPWVLRTFGCLVSCCAGVLVSDDVEEAILPSNANLRGSRGPVCAAPRGVGTVRCVLFHAQLKWSSMMAMSPQQATLHLAALSWLPSLLFL